MEHEKRIDELGKDMSELREGFVRLDAKVEKHNELQLQVVEALKDGIKELNEGFRKFTEKYEFTINKINENEKSICSIKSFAKGAWWAIGILGFGVTAILIKLFS